MRRPFDKKRSCTLCRHSKAKCEFVPSTVPEASNGALAVRCTRCEHKNLDCDARSPWHAGAGGSVRARLSTPSPSTSTSSEGSGTATPSSQDEEVATVVAQSPSPVPGTSKPRIARLVEHFGTAVGQSVKGGVQRARDTVKAHAPKKGNKIPYRRGSEGDSGQGDLQSLNLRLCFRERVTSAVTQPMATELPEVFETPVVLLPEQETDAQTRVPPRLLWSNLLS